LQFATANATPKIAKEYVFANAIKFAEKSLWVTKNCGKKQVKFT
jgi:hypothetical protein